MISFALILIIWAGFGLAGVWNCKADRINYEMLIFMGSAPFLPLVAKFFKIF